MGSLQGPTLWPQARQRPGSAKCVPCQAAYRSGKPGPTGPPEHLGVASSCRHRAYVITRKWRVVTTGPGNVPPPPSQPACLIGSQLFKSSTSSGVGLGEVAALATLLAPLLAPVLLQLGGGQGEDLGSTQSVLRLVMGPLFCWSVHDCQGKSRIRLQCVDGSVDGVLWWNRD